jgi:hypothetical protein
MWRRTPGSHQARFPRPQPGRRRRTRRHDRNEPEEPERTEDFEDGDQEREAEDALGQPRDRSAPAREQAAAQHDGADGEAGADDRERGESARVTSDRHLLLDPIVDVTLRR